MKIKRRKKRLLLKDTETKLNLFHWIFLKEGEKIIALAIPTGNTERGIGFQDYNKKFKRRFTTRKPTWTLSDCDHLAQPQRILGAGDEGSRGGGVRRPSGTVRGAHSGKLKGSSQLQVPAPLPQDGGAAPLSPLPPHPDQDPREEDSLPASPKIHIAGGPAHWTASIVQYSHRHH